MEKIKNTKKAKIGIYTMGLQCYWAQFDGLWERLLSYGKFIASKVEAMGASVYYYGLVDCEEEGHKAGEYFVSNHVDLILAHSGTYVTSASVLPVHQICKAMTVILNLQPAARIDYEKTTTGEWLAHCGACPVPELTGPASPTGLSMAFWAFTKHRKYLSQMKKLPNVRKPSRHGKKSKNGCGPQK